MHLCPFYYTLENCRFQSYILNYLRFTKNSNDIYNRVVPKKTFSTEEAIYIAKQLGINFDRFNVEQFRTGLDVELEHGRRDPLTNVTNDDPILTGKIALAHLNEFPDYYTRLGKLEEDAKKYWNTPD